MKFSVHIFSLFLILATSTIGCNSHSQSVPDITSEDYLVYSTLVNDLSSSREHRLALISDSTLTAVPTDEVKYSGSKKILVYRDLGIGNNAPSLSEGVKQIWPELDLEFFQVEFGRNNANSYALLLDSIHAAIPVQRSKKDSISSFMIRNGEALQIWFSRVAFNRGHNEAIIYLDYICGSLCGEGRWCWLKKSQGSWTVFKSFHTWVS